MYMFKNQIIVIIFNSHCWSTVSLLSMQGWLLSLNLFDIQRLFCHIYYHRKLNHQPKGEKKRWAETLSHMGKDEFPASPHCLLCRNILSSFTSFVLLSRKNVLGRNKVKLKLQIKCHFSSNRSYFSDVRKCRTRQKY